MKDVQCREERFGELMIREISKCNARPASRRFVHFVGDHDKSHLYCDQLEPARHLLYRVKFAIPSHYYFPCLSLSIRSPPVRSINSSLYIFLFRSLLCGPHPHFPMFPVAAIKTSPLPAPSLTLAIYSYVRSLLSLHPIILRYMPMIAL